MAYLKEALKQKQLAPTLVLVAVVLLASWMGNTNGGYFIGEWALVALILAALALIVSATGAFRGTGSRWSTVALGLFVVYTAWTFASLLWSPNRGDAWFGAGQTLLYLLAFGLAVGLVSLGASRNWVLAASAIGPAAIAAFTLPTLAPRLQDLFDDNRLAGTVGYWNGEAAFLLVPFWAAVYLAGSRSINPILRGVVLAGAVLSVSVVVLTQSRGAMVAMAVSLPVFFLISGQRLRGLFALAPIAGALLVTFPDLNEVYLALRNQESVPDAIEQVLPTVWLTTAGAGLYGILWGLVDRRWRPPSSVTRIVGGVALAVSIAVLIFGAAAASERVGNPVTWGEQKWEAFKTNDGAGQEQSRYLRTGSSRYTLWQVAWEDFASRPLLGIGTHNYEATYYQLREQQAEAYVRQPHALPLEVLSERGIVGGVLFFSFLITCLGAGLWKRFRHLSSEGKAQIGAMVAAITYWFVHSSAEWFWQLPAVTLPAIIYLAMLVGPWRQQVEATSPRWPLRAVGAGLALLAIAAVAPLYAADWQLARSYALTQSWAAMDLQAAQEATESAQRFNPVAPRLREREAILAMLSGDWSRAEEAYVEATRLNPEHYAPYVELARFYERVGEPEKALQAYRQALDLNPLDRGLEREVDEFEEEVEA